MIFFRLHSFVCSYQTKDFDQVEEELVNREFKHMAKIGPL